MWDVSIALNMLLKKHVSTCLGIRLFQRILRMGVTSSKLNNDDGVWRKAPGKASGYTKYFKVR